MTELVTLKCGVNVSRHDVSKSLLHVDPDGVKCRSHGTIVQRIYEMGGPLVVCHMDGNDKLKRFSFPLHGCIDGFSRKLLWLTTSTTTNDSLGIANHYLGSRLGMVPRLLRMDLGTGNVYCEELQVFFHKAV